MISHKKIIKKNKHNKKKLKKHDSTHMKYLSSAQRFGEVNLYTIISTNKKNTYKKKPT